MTETAESGTDKDNDMDGTDGIRSDMWPSSDELRKEFLTVLGTVDSCEEGDLSGRARLTCKGIRVEQKLLKAVDDLTVEEYHKGEPDVWKLNCLVYAGAETVSRWVRQRTLCGSPEKQAGQTRKETEVLQLRKTIGWLLTEINRRKDGTRATSRQWRNIRWLRAERCSLRELEASLETKKVALELG